MHARVYDQQNFVHSYPQAAEAIRQGAPRPVHFLPRDAMHPRTSHGPVSVRLSVRPSQVGVLLKQLNVGSHKQHRAIAQGL